MNNKIKIKAIIFDCFGVLVTDALEALINSKNLSNIEMDQIRSCVGAANKGLISKEEYRSELSNILDMDYQDFSKSLIDGEKKDNDLMDYILKLKKDYKLGMLSNVSSMDSLRSRFDDNELESHFDQVIASGQIGFAKPEAEAYEIAADKLGVYTTECIMIDDREDYVNAAIGVGMQGIKYIGLDKLKDQLKDIL